MAEPLSVLSLVSLSGEARQQIEDVDDRVALTMAPGWFDGEIRQTWGEYVAQSYVKPGSVGQGTRDQRDRLLESADVIIGGFPVPLDLRSRSSRLRWFHQTPAGASNLRGCDLWESDVIVTTSRGLGNTLAIAEYVIASFLRFARDLHRAEHDRQRRAFHRFEYRPTLLAGKTMCVIGVGGIGAEVGRLGAALGMRVVGTRRSATAGPVDGFAEVTGPERLHELLAQSQFVAVCCQATPETEGLIDSTALSALPEGAVLVNVARGEIIDEQALIDHLDRLRGVALDVYIGEFERLPPPALWEHPRVLITPHTSAGAESRSNRPIELFCRNLGAFLAGRELENTVDWSRGY